MSKAYKVIKRTLMFDKSNPKTGHTVVPVNYAQVIVRCGGSPHLNNIRQSIDNAIQSVQCNPIRCHCHAI